MMERRMIMKTKKLYIAPESLMITVPSHGLMGKDIWSAPEEVNRGHPYNDTSDYTLGGDDEYGQQGARGTKIWSDWEEEW